MIRSYNPRRLWHCLFQEREQYPDLPSQLRTRKLVTRPDFDPLVQRYYDLDLESSSRLGSKWFFDRTETLPHYFQIFNASTIPAAARSFNLTFAECCLMRAGELLGLGKKLRIFWSGGLDSTTVLFALRALNPPRGQVQVLGTYTSIIESGFLFDQFVKTEFDTQIFPPVHNREFFRRVSETDSTSDAIYLTGNPANSLFPARLDALLSPELARSEKYYALLNEDYRPYVRQDVLEFIAPVLAKSERPIETVGDFNWFSTFFFKWNAAIEELRWEIGASLAEKVLHFYDTEDFQKWVIANREPCIQDQNGDLFKWPMKRALVQFGCDKRYALKKRPNFSSSLLHDSHWLFTDENYNHFYAKSPSIIQQGST